MDTYFLGRFAKYFRCNCKTGDQRIKVERKKKSPPDERLSLVCHHICLAEMNGLMGPSFQVSRLGQLMGPWLFQGGPVSKTPASLSSKGPLSHITNTFLGNFIELLLKQFMCTAIMGKLAILTHCKRMFLKRATLLVKTDK